MCGRWGGWCGPVVGGVFTTPLVWFDGWWVWVVCASRGLVGGCVVGAGLAVGVPVPLAWDTWVGLLGVCGWCGLGGLSLGWRVGRLRVAPRREGLGVCGWCGYRWLCVAVGVVCLRLLLGLGCWVAVGRCPTTPRGECAFPFDPAGASHPLGVMPERVWVAVVCGYISHPATRRESGTGVVFLDGEVRAQGGGGRSALYLWPRGKLFAGLGSGCPR